MHQRVLVTVDDPMLRGLYKKIFENTGGFLSIDFAATKSEAADRLKKTSYDFALLDINLGETEHDGFDLLQLINSNNKDTKVMMMSSMLSDQVEPLCRLLGARGFTPKNQDLIQNLRKWLTVVVAENCFKHLYHA
jgi:CheY-like chemotaxis protein